MSKKMFERGRQFALEDMKDEGVNRIRSIKKSQEYWKNLYEMASDFCDEYGLWGKNYNDFMDGIENVMIGYLERKRR